MKLFVLGLGLSIGGGLIYLLATDETFRMVALVVTAFLLGIGLCIVLTVVIGNQTSKNQQRVLEALKPGAVNNKIVPPAMPFYQVQQPSYFQQQLPAQVIQPPVIDGTSGEVIG